MRFRPCIDIHNGKVKQIVGGSLLDKGNQAIDNFVSELDGSYYGELYKKDGLFGGHIILLNPEGSEYYEADLEQAYKALGAFKGGLQIGGGITDKNAKSFLEHGATHVIVTSFVFKNGEINYDNLIQTAYLPLVFVDCIDSTFKADLGEGGFLEVLYTADGKNPSYNNTKPFVLDASYYVSNTDSYDPITQNSSITTKWDTFGTIYDVQEKKWAAAIGIRDNMKILKSEEEKANFPSNAYWMIPVDNSDGYCCTHIIRCRVIKNNQTALVAYIPVHMLLNKYGNSAINGWDGNGLSLDEEGGVILAPQVGAGIKNADNTFTGVVIGEAVEGDEDRIGLLGYNHGQRSIFLDAKTGKAEFGLNNSGKIVLDPTDRRAKIYSGNFPNPEVNHFKDIDLSESQGMMIDVSRPPEYAKTTRFISSFFMRKLLK